MQNGNRLTQEQRLALRLSQQQIKLGKLLELTAPELEEKVSQELESNPALEALPDNFPQSEQKNEPDDWRDVRWRPAGSASPLPAPEYPVAEETRTLYDHLHAQLDVLELDPETRLAAEYIIGSLDPNGYLRTSLEDIGLDIAVAEGTDIPQSSMKEALAIIRSLDPPGVAAADLRDALILQLLRLPRSDKRDNALAILRKRYEDLPKKHYDAIARGLRLTQEQVTEAADLIRELNPKPGAQFETRSDSASNFVVPDYILEEGENGLTITVANRIPELAIQQSFTSAVENIRRAQGSSSADRKGAEYIFSRVNDARDFIRLLAQRQKTMMSVASAILAIQKDYFETRNLRLMRPMMIKDITELTGLDASHISRATSGKFIQTPWGIFPMRFFFSDSRGEKETIPEQSDEESLTTRSLEADIREIVDSEDKKNPLSDEQIMEQLHLRGYDISRRTVSKYRTRLGISSVWTRKER